MKISKKIIAIGSATTLMLATMLASANVKPDPCYRCYTAYTQCLQNLGNDPLYCYNLWVECSQGTCS